MSYLSFSAVSFELFLLRAASHRTKELRLRDQQIAAREADLLARENAVLLREQAILGRENALRAGIEALNTRAMMNHELEMENARPRGSAGDDLLARVASRPSMVPRRPLEERRAR